MTPALEGAHIYARGQQASHPDHTVSVVVVTDGEPRDCGSSLQGTAAVISAAMTGVPAIRTYVLGVGPSVGNLTVLAQAGAPRRRTSSSRAAKPRSSPRSRPSARARWPAISFFQ